MMSFNRCWRIGEAESRSLAPRPSSTFLDLIIIVNLVHRLARTGLSLDKTEIVRAMHSSREEGSSDGIRAASFVCQLRLFDAQVSPTWYVNTESSCTSDSFTHVVTSGVVLRVDHDRTPSSVHSRGRGLHAASKPRRSRTQSDTSYTAKAIAGRRSGTGGRSMVEPDTLMR